MDVGAEDKEVGAYRRADGTVGAEEKGVGAYRGVKRTTFRSRREGEVDYATERRGEADVAEIVGEELEEETQRVGAGWISGARDGYLEVRR